jgi:hypothetical protein
MRSSRCSCVGSRIRLPPFFFLMVEGCVEVSSYYEILGIKTPLKVLKGGTTFNFFLINSGHIHINSI